MRDQGGSVGLVPCAAAAAGVAVEVFMVEQQVAPMRIGGVTAFITVTGTAALGVGQEKGGQTPGI